MTGPSIRLGVGDRVQSPFSGDEKIVVAIEGRRCLCVNEREIGPDGSIRHGARVARFPLGRVEKLDRPVFVKPIDAARLFAYHRGASPTGRRWRAGMRLLALAMGVALLAGGLVAVVHGVLSLADRERRKLEDRGGVDLQDVMDSFQKAQWEDRGR